MEELQYRRKRNKYTKAKRKEQLKTWKKFTTEGNARQSIGVRILLNSVYGLGFCLF